MTWQEDPNELPAKLFIVQQRAWSTPPQPIGDPSGRTKDPVKGLVVVP